MKDFCRIYLTDFSQLPDLTCRQLLERLPPSRRERIEGMGAAGRAQSVAAAALLYEGLLEEDRPEGFTLRQIPAGELTAPRLALAAARCPLDWTPSSRGKPFPEGMAVGGERLYASLSHSGGWAAAALCSGPVGLDIQTPDPLPGERLARIAARFHPGEAAALAAAPEAARPAAFYRLWAMKESVMKLSGDGFALPLKSFPGDPPRAWRRDGAVGRAEGRDSDDGNRGACSLHRPVAGPGRAVGFCTFFACQPFGGVL